MYPLLSKDIIESFIKNYDTIVDSIDKNTTIELKDKYTEILFYEESGGLYLLINEIPEDRLKIIFDNYLKKFEYKFNDDLNQILLEFGIGNSGMNVFYYIYDITFCIEQKNLFEKSYLEGKIKDNITTENYQKLFDRINNNDLELLKIYYDKLIALLKRRLPFDDFP